MSKSLKAQPTCNPFQDSLALVALYDATNGSSWTNKTNWKVAGKPISSWYGVMVNTQGCVIQVYLPNNNISNTLPNIKLPNLTRIVLDSNQLTGTIPLFDTTSLQEINLGYNQFTGSIPNFNLPNLTHLNLHNNQLSGNIPNFNFLNLTWLGLANNKLTGSIPNFNLPNLTYLILDFNQLSGNIPNFNLPNLLYISARFNKLTGSIPNFNLSYLTFLNFDSNQLSGSIPNFNLPNLTFLYLQYNQLTGTIPNFLYPNLKYLDLSNNLLVGGIPNFDLSNLISVQLNNNQLTGDILDFPSPNLAQYAVNNNKLSGAIPPLATIVNLKCENNQFTFNGILPNVPPLTSKTYAPQDSFYTKTTLTPAVGTDVTIDLGIDATITANNYRWYKNGVFFKDTNRNKLILRGVKASDAGVYKVQVTNTSAPLLTLNGRDITVSPVSPTGTCWVTNTNDAGAGSLREAINCANTNTGPDTIKFALTSSSPWVINLATALPTLSDAGTVIDATTQTGWTLGSVQVVGNANIATGLNITGNNTEIYGLFLKDFSSPTGSATGIYANGSQGLIIGAAGKGNIVSGITSVGNGSILLDLQNCGATIKGNYLGTNITGTAAYSTQTAWGIALGGGIYKIGSNATGDRNIISGCFNGAMYNGNGSSCTLQFIGNYCGTDVTGNVNLSNGSISPYDLLAGSSISNNIVMGSIGIYSASTGVSIFNNKINIGANGSTINSSSYGIFVTDWHGAYPIAPTTNITISQNSVAGASTGIAVGILGSTDGNGVQKVKISGNSIYCNTTQGILRKGISNNSKQAPVITTATTAIISGTCQVGDYIEIFINDNTGCTSNTICQGKTFIGSVTSTSTTWSLPLSASPPAGTKITATATDTQGNTSEFAACVTMTAPCTPATTPTISASQTTNCGTQSTTLTIATGVLNSSTSWVWYAGSCGGTSIGSGVSISVSPSVTTTYYVRGEGGSCTAGSCGSVTITVNSAPSAPSVGTITQPTCTIATGSVVLNGLPTGSWTLIRSPGNVTATGTGTSTTISGLAAGTYTYTVTNSLGCISPASTSIVINTQPTQPAAPTASDVFYCQNATASPLTATGTSLLWYTTGTGGTGTTTAPTPSTATVGTIAYYVTQTISGCESPRKAILVTVGSVIATVSTTATCSGQSNGTATVAVTSGTAPFTYSWGNGGTTATISNLAVGNYNVTVTDAKGCSTVKTATVTQSAAVIVTLSIQKSISCYGSNDGIITATASGSTNPFTFAWSTGATTSTISNLAAGTYAVTVKDVNSCTTTNSVNLTEPTDVISTPTITPITCKGYSNGSIALTTSGGASPYTYFWSNNASTSTVSNLAVGTYSVTVTDENGCPDTLKNLIITEPALLDYSAVIGQVSPPGGQNGKITLNMTGGTPAYSINMSLGSTSIAQTGGTPPQYIYGNLAKGSYFFMATDSKGCMTSGTIVVTEVPCGITLTTSATPAKCFGESTGSVSVVAANGTAPYTYRWSNGSTVASVCCIPAGTYSVTVTDAAGCTATTAVVVTQPPALIIGTPSVTNVVCNGGNTGRVIVAATGGTGTITYSISPAIGTQSGGTFNGLTAQTYIFTATDASGCTATRSATISQPPALVIGTPSVTNVTCNGGNNGSVIVSATGGTGAITYSISPVVGTQSGGTFSGLTAQTYTFTATDAGGCTATRTATVTQLSALVFGTPSVTNVTCNGGNNGRIIVSATGGTGAITYSISPVVGTQSGGTFSGLTAQTYIFTATDVNGCSATVTQTATVTQPTALVIGTPTVTNVTCNGGNTGRVVISATGGTGAITYSISPVVGTQSGGTFNGLTAQTYTFTATDASGCSATRSVTVTQSPVLAIGTPTVTNVTCNGGNTGRVVISATGGTGAITYSISPVVGTQSGGTFNGLTAQTYTFTATDASGCTATQSATVTQPPALVMGTPTVTNVTCNGGNTGRVIISATGGTGTITYSISPVVGTQSGGTFNGLTAQTYTFTATDASGCSATRSVTVTQPTALVIGTPIVTNLTCNGSSTGSVTVSAIGGTGAITYSISPAVGTQSGGTFNGLTAQTYIFTATDASGCSATRSVTVTQSPGLVIGTPTVTNVTCNGGNTGRVIISATGGTGTITYSISPVVGTQSGGTFNGLTAQIYTFTATDASGCTATQSATVTQPPALVMGTPSVTNVTCNGGNTGRVIISATGGTGAITYSISPVVGTQSGGTFNGLTAQTYTFTATDASGCTATQSATVTQPPALVIGTPTITNVTCNGGNTGRVVISATGGTGAITYSISPVVGTQSGGTFNGLTAQTYTFTATDASGCSATRSVTVTQSPVLVIGTPTVTNVACNGGNTGRVVISATGGTGAIIYSISPVVGTQSGGTFNGLTAQTYTFTATDASGCSATRSVTVTQSPVLVIGTPTVTNVTCNGGNTGRVAVSATGGTGAITYSISPAVGTQSGGTFSGLTAQTYTFTATDAGGCTATRSATITQPSALVINVSTTNVSCFGGSDGSITSSVTGGFFPYSYQWSNGATTPDINGLVAGTYSLTVTDANNCSKTISQTVSSISAINLTHSSTNVACNGGNTGSVIVVASGGTSPYTYLWSNGARTSSITNLSAGNYSVTVTDANQCSVAGASITITEPTTIATNETVTHIQNIGQTGSIILNLTGGTAPYTVVLRNTLGASMLQTGGIPPQYIFSNLPKGTYTYTVTDAKGCTKSGSITINEPSCNISLSPQITNVKCNGQSNGSISLTSTGGTAPYTYTWSNGATTATINNLTTGNYTVTVTDAVGCSFIQTFTVTEPSVLGNLINVVSATCFGGQNGSASVAGTGGTMPYSYLWSNNAITSAISNLAAGTYTVTTTDANGCTALGVATIRQPSELLGAIVITQTVSCNGSGNTSDGILTASATGGVSPYSFKWSNNATTAAISNLPAGTYTVTVTDGAGCTATKSAILTAPTPISVSATSTNASTAGGTGSITLNLSGGTPIYTVTMKNAAGANMPQTGGTPPQYIFGNLPKGTYTYTATDSKGCSSSGSITITEPLCSMTVSAQGTGVKCNGGSDGTATATATNGTAPITYSWSNGATTASISNLTGGAYSVTVTDAMGCTGSSTVFIGQPPVLAATITPTAVTCNGTQTGSASTTASGGVSPYTYLWSNGARTSSITNLSAGNYSVTVTDANQCSAAASITITEPTAIATNETVTHIQNIGQTGSITLNLTGGTAPYTVVLRNTLGASMPQTGGTPPQYIFSNLPKGTYTYTVTDAKGCTKSGSITINEPSCNISLSPQITNVKCNGQSNGSISLTPSGGTAPYTYTWSNGATTATINNLTAGNYTVTVTDAIGCSFIQTFTVTELSILGNLINVVSATCFGGQNGSASVAGTGGTTPYSYLWSNNATTSAISNLVAGTYTVTTTDANGCTALGVATIRQPSELLGAIVITQTVSCNGSGNTSDGILTASATGGISPYSFKWSNNATTAAISNLPAGTYTVTVTDGAGCTAIKSAILTAPTPISVSATSTNASTAGGTGSITLNLSGGTPIYTVTMKNAAGANMPQTGGTPPQYIFGNLPKGTYTYTVTDSKGCSSSGSITINEPSCDLTPNSQISNVKCNGGQNGSITLTPTGGRVPYTYLWSNGATTGTITNLTAGTYTVTVTDSLSCQTITTLTVTQPALLTTTVTKTDIANIGGTGEIKLTVSGGTSPYTASMILGTTNIPQTSGTPPQYIYGNLAKGLYQYTVTDANGCVSTGSVAISEPGCSIAITGKADSVLCQGESNGRITTTVLNGTGTLTYQWSNPAIGNVANPQNLTAGTYTVTVSDAQNCQSIATIAVFQPSKLSVTPALTHVVPIGNNNGEIKLTIAGGTLNYAVVLTTNSNTVVPLTSQEGNNVFVYKNLTKGVYKYIVTDFHGCRDSATLIINDPSCGNISVSDQIIPVSCKNGQNGRISLTASGGTSPYRYTWNLATIGNTSTPNNLSAGDYAVTITDSLGCFTTKTYTVPEPNALLSSFTVRAVSLPNGNDGRITVNVTGGTQPYTVTIGTLTATATSATTFVFDSLTKGSYLYLVTDANGCTTTQTVIINEPICGTITASMRGDTTVCGGQIAILHFSVQGASSFILNYTNGVDTFHSTVLDAVTIPTTTTTYRLLSVQSGVCSSPVSTNNTVLVTVTTPSVPTGLKAEKDSLCTGLDIRLSIDAINSSSYIWQTPFGDRTTTVPQLIVPNATIANTGNYSVRTSQNGCLSAVTTPIIIRVFNKPTEKANAGVDIIECDKTTSTLKASAILTQGATGRWTALNNSALANPTSIVTTVSNLNTGKNNFIWILSNAMCGEFSRDTVTVSVTPKPDLAITPQINLDSKLTTALINIGELFKDKSIDTSLFELKITKKPEKTIVEIRGNGIFFDRNNLTEAQTIELEFTVCSKTCTTVCNNGKIVLTLQALVDESNITVPKFFSTSSQTGASLEINGIEFFINNEVTIVDRWGVIVFGPKPYKNGILSKSWDGKKSGKPLPSGAYYYIIRYDDQSILKFKKGIIYLVEEN